MELMDIVDGNDEVVGTASRDDVYGKMLTHRISHVIVFNARGDMALQLRSGVSFCPFHWCTTAGGHVRAGETYEEAAVRELEEETGKKLPVKFGWKDVYTHASDSGTIKKFLATFTAEFDGDIAAGDGVERVEFFSLNAINRMISSGEKFHPELLFLLRKHYGIRI